jgi:hypothetical protein
LLEGLANLPLNARQRIAYRERCSLWRPVYSTHSGTGEQIATSYTLVATNVPCLLVNTESPEVPGSLARYQQASFFTRDSWHFAIDQEVGAEFLIQNTTVDRYGVASPLNGKYWIVSGDPQKFPALGGRNANFKLAKAVQQPDPPKGFA